MNQIDKNAIEKYAEKYSQLDEEAKQAVKIVPVDPRFLFRGKFVISALIALFYIAIWVLLNHFINSYELWKPINITFFACSLYVFGIRFYQVYRSTKHNVLLSIFMGFLFWIAALILFLVLNYMA